MEAILALKAEIPGPARDLALNLSSVLEPGVLSPAQRWGVALACAITTGSTPLKEAVRAAAAAEVGAEVMEDAQAAAALMAMNNVFYRFRHFVGKPGYSQRPARLRMNRLVRPAGSKADFELICLAVSAINGCEVCVRSHEEAVLAAALTEDHVLDAVRIAATMRGVAVALDAR